MYKIYLVKLLNGMEIPLLAKHNREAMVLTGRFQKWYGNVLKVINAKGMEVINNEKIFNL
ncbi:hypothetical protein [uncultured Tyzzerella sp.]|uniref:hypothetical protein n=1 Tax=uncultured Tyzzerella sp. TaxID=2321398 RepID=UPI0029427D75|nr:hypothetical protein [uncultured Tyzzerella sp.]